MNTFDLTLTFDVLTLPNLRAGGALHEPRTLTRVRTSDVAFLLQSQHLLLLVVFECLWLRNEPQHQVPPSDFHSFMNKCCSLGHVLENVNQMMKVVLQIMNNSVLTY